MMTVGRNDLCPCGSERKFKHCCLRVQDVEDNLRVRLRSAEGALVPALFSYATQEFGPEFFDEAWDDFFLWNDVPDDIETSKLHPTLPVMQNTDGDPIELTTLTYELGVPIAEAVERLTPLATLRGDVHLADEARGTLADTR